MKPDDVQQLAQAFVASWETQLARALREPHMLSSLMGMMQQGGYGVPPSASPQNNANPWASANPFANASTYANPFAGAANYAASPTGFSAADHTSANHATDAESGAAAGADHTERVTALEHAIAALAQRMGQLEQQLAGLHGRNESTQHDAKPAAKTRSRTAASTAKPGTGSRKPAAKKA